MRLVFLAKVEDTSEAIRFELEDMKTGPDVEPFLVELLHQASYRTNTLGLPCICPEESIGKFSEEDLKEFLASHYTPSRLVLAGVNVRHEQLVQLAREHFVAAPTSWDGVKPREVDGSMAQFTSGEVKVCVYIYACMCVYVHICMCVCVCVCECFDIRDEVRCMCCERTLGIKKWEVRSDSEWFLYVALAKKLNF